MSSCLITSRRLPRYGGQLVLEVEDLLELAESLVGRSVTEIDEVLRHLVLPRGVDVQGGHARDRLVERRRLEVADQEAVLAHEQGVVVPAGVGERSQHVRPDRSMPFLVLREEVGPDLQLETDAAHGVLRWPPGPGSGCARPGRLMRDL